MAVIKKITAPGLNVSNYGKNIQEQFNNIDDNFQALSNADYVRGARGEGLDLIYVSIDNEGTFTFKEDKEFLEDGVLDGESGKVLKNSIINAFKNYVTGDTWYYGSSYTFYVEENDGSYKVHNIYPIIYLHQDHINLEDDKNEYLEFEYSDSGVLRLVNIKKFPSLYYDTAKNRYCWYVNGKKSGIIAQGEPGTDGAPGPGMDFEVAWVDTDAWDKDGAGTFHRLKRVYWNNKLQDFDPVVGGDTNNAILSEQDVEWIRSGRAEWLAANKNRTFLIVGGVQDTSKTDTQSDDIEVDSQADETADGSTDNTVINVLHLCKLVKLNYSELLTKYTIDTADIPAVKDPILSYEGGNSGIIKVPITTLSEEGSDTTPTKTAVLGTSSTRVPASSSGLSATLIDGSIIKDTALISALPIYSTEVTDSAKTSIKNQYSTIVASNNILADAKQITAGDVTIINQDVIQSCSTALNKTVDDVWGVYLTPDNRYMLSSLISSGTGAGFAASLTDMYYNTTNSTVLRYIWWNDNGNDKAGDDGIVLYNNDNDNVNSYLNILHVETPGKFAMGSQPPEDLKAAGDTHVKIGNKSGDKGAGHLYVDNINSEKVNTNEISVPGTNKTTIDGDGVNTVQMVSSKILVPDANGATTTINNTGVNTNKISVSNEISVSSNPKTSIKKISNTNKIIDLVTVTVDNPDWSKWTCIDFPQIIYNIMKDVGDNFGNNITNISYSGDNFDLKIRKTTTDNKYKMTGYIDFYGNEAADEIGHMIVDTFFNYDDSKVTIPYRTDGTNNDNSPWALPYAGWDKNEIDSISEKAIGLSSMSGPYMESTTVVTTVSPQNTQVSIDFPKNYNYLSGVGTHGVDFGISEKVVFKYVTGGGNNKYILTKVNDNTSLSEVQPINLLSHVSINPSQISITTFNKSHWITKTSYPAN